MTEKRYGVFLYETYPFNHVIKKNLEEYDKDFPTLEEAVEFAEAKILASECEFYDVVNLNTGAFVVCR